MEPQDQATVLHTESTGSLKDILSKYSEMFHDTLGLVKGLKMKLHMNPGSQPRFNKPRSVPFALREKIEAELERLCKEKVMEPVQFREWATPIVPGDGSIRICGNYKITVNRAASVESYPIPRIEDLLASIGNAKVISKLDVSHAYQQLELDNVSKYSVTITTHKGLYRYYDLPFGVASAPATGFIQSIEKALNQRIGLNRH